MFNHLGTIYKISQGILGTLIKLLWRVLIILLVWPLKFLTRTMGVFMGFFIYLGYFMVLYAAFISLFEYQASKVPWTHMTDFSSLSWNERDTIISMAEMSAYAYVTDSDASSYLNRLRSKGYETFGRPHINEEGLTYVTLKKGNTIYLAFRGSDSVEDWETDAKMIFGLITTNTDRFISARNVAEDLLASNPGKNLVLVGHSLGGAMVQYVVNELPSSRITRAYTFNPLGIPDGVARTCTNKLTDVIHEADIAQLVMGEKHVVGRGILVRGKYSESGNEELGLTDLVDQHSIKLSIMNMRSQHEQMCPIPSR